MLLNVVGEGRIGIGVVGAIVDAPGFGALLGGLDHEAGDGEHVLGFPAGGVVKDFVENVLRPEVDDFAGFIESGSGAFDADVSPHEGAERVANVVEVQFGAMGLGNVAGDGSWRQGEAA